jgi:site-specific DNA recombinase
MYLENLAAMTHRGQTGAVTRGQHVGPPPFGYRLVPTEPGKPNELVIDGDTATMVRRMFADYLAGQSARDIAAAFNAAQIPGPRGEPWNASAIGGSRKRMKVPCRTRSMSGKSSGTGKSSSKIPTLASASVAPIPRGNGSDPRHHIFALSIKQRSKVQARRADRGGEHRYHATQPRHLLSGLLKCGCCGSSYIVSGADKRGAYLRCSRMVENGTVR